MLALLSGWGCNGVDGGDSKADKKWVQASNGIPTTSDPRSIRSIPCMTNYGNTLIAATLGGGLRFSSDQGMNWQYAGIFSMEDVIFSLAVIGDDLFAGSYGGVFRSPRLGGGWTRVNSGLADSTILSMVLSLATDGTRLYIGTYAGVFRSDSKGESWVPAGIGFPPNSEVNTLLVNGDWIVAGTKSSGLYRSSDKGETWKEINSGLADKEILSLAGSPPALFAGTKSGLFTSSDNGGTWTANAGLPKTSIPALLLHGQTLFTSTYSESARSVYRSTDNGASWTDITGALPQNDYVMSLMVNKEILYAGGYNLGIWKLPL